MVEVPIENIPTDKNIISSHFLYKIKLESELTNKQSKKRFNLKSRLWVHLANWE